MAEPSRRARRCPSPRSLYKKKQWATGLASQESIPASNRSAAPSLLRPHHLQPLISPAADRCKSRCSLVKGLLRGPSAQQHLNAGGTSVDGSYYVIGMQDVRDFPHLEHRAGRLTAIRRAAAAAERARPPLDTAVRVLDCVEMAHTGPAPNGQVRGRTWVPRMPSPHRGSADR